MGPQELRTRLTHPAEDALQEAQQGRRETEPQEVGLQTERSLNSGKTIS